MTPAGPASKSSLRDNRSCRGTVGNFLKTEIQPRSNLSFVSAYFTVLAFEALADQLKAEDAIKVVQALDAALLAALSTL